LALFATLGTLLPLLVLAHSSGHLGGSTSGHLEIVWGKHGRARGELHKPRAIAIDDQDRLYIVDKTARIQVFDRDGQFLHGWQTPDSVNGKPTGLSFDGQGNLLVADTHYFRILVYRPDGQLLTERTLGGTFGHAPGTFGLVTDAVTDSQGNLYIAEYGEYDRIQKFSPRGEFVFQWGGHGSEPGQFIRPQNLVVDEQDRVWVADACNDRIQVFDATGTSAKLVQIWGERGSELGQLRYPYDLILDQEGHVYVCEFGNHRVQKFTRDGQPLASWGVQGRGPGELSNPWGLVQDRRGRIHVLDTYNHRVQRIRL
jgi:DNA-binding beta-propeller fold protein YncE